MESKGVHSASEHPDEQCFACWSSCDGECDLCQSLWQSAGGLPHCFHDSERCWRVQADGPQAYEHPGDGRVDSPGTPRPAVGECDRTHSQGAWDEPVREHPAWPDPDYAGALR